MAQLPERDDVEGEFPLLVVTVGKIWLSNQDLLSPVGSPMMWNQGPD